MSNPEQNTNLAVPDFLSVASNKFVPDLLAKPYALAVVIGRFQPFHYGHAAMLWEALRCAETCLVVLGSSFHAANSKNPWQWQTRQHVIEMAVQGAIEQGSLDSGDQARIHFAPVADRYDTQLWAQDVQEAAAMLLMKGDRPLQHTDATHPQLVKKIALIGHLKDASSLYLKAFPDWTFIALDNVQGINASSIRQTLYEDILHGSESFTEQGQALAPSTLAFLKTYAQTPQARELAKEYQLLEQDKKAWLSAPYPVNHVTVDVLIRFADSILLIQRTGHPGKDLWALPGGYLEPYETLWQGALRELQEETGLVLSEPDSRSCCQRVQVFDHPARSLRGRVITHAFYFDLRLLGGDPLQEIPQVKGADDARQAKWWALDAVPDLREKLHDDHFHIMSQLMSTE